MADNKATSKAQEFKALSKKDQQRKIGDLILNNAMYIIIAIAIIFITVKQSQIHQSFFNRKYYFPDGGKTAHRPGDRRLYRTDRYGYFRRPCGRSGSVYLRFLTDHCI